MGIPDSAFPQNALGLGLQQIGTFRPPPNLRPGTTTFGNYAHEQAAAILQGLYPKVPFDLRVGPGMRGIDVTVPRDYVGEVGFPYGEIKPLTPSGEASLRRQLERWGLTPEQVRAITYEPSGNVYYGFR